MFKKIICITMVIFMLIASSVFADENKTHTFEDNNFSIDLPSDWITVTKDTPETDIAFDKYDLEYSAIQENFLNNDLIVFGCPKALPIEINLYSWEDGESLYYGNFKYAKREYKDWEKTTMFNMEDPEFSQEVYNTFIKSYKTKQAIYFVFESIYKKQVGRNLSGITIINGRFYQITFCSQTGEITKEQFELFYKTLDNLKFLQVNKKEFNYDFLVVLIPIVLSFFISFLASNIKKNKKPIRQTSAPQTKIHKQKRRKKDDYPSSPDL